MLDIQTVEKCVPSPPRSNRCRVEKLLIVVLCLRLCMLLLLLLLMLGTHTRGVLLLHVHAWLIVMVVREPPFHVNRTLDGKLRCHVGMHHAMIWLRRYWPRAWCSVSA